MAALAIGGNLISPTATEAAKVDFNKEIKPLLEVHCVSCHSGKKPKGKYSLENREGAFEDPEIINAGKPADSYFLELCAMDEDEDDVMPPVKEGLLNSAQVDLLRRWIKEGAEWPADAKLEAKKKARFVKDVQPIFEFNCVSCHNEEHDKGDVRMDNPADLFKGGESGPGVVPGHADQSWVYTTMTLSKDDDLLMPPAKKGGPLPADEIEIIRLWIEQGAWMPKDTKLQARKKIVKETGDDRVTIGKIREMILAKLPAKTEAEMKELKILIPGTETTFTMVPIPGGEFVMGSPEDEDGRKADEGPQRKVKVAPFWMGKFEVTWNEFELFMYRDEERKYKDFIPTDPKIDVVSDAVARPTQPYVEMSFGMGKDGYPAISMTQHAARKYCQWMSAKTGYYLRLPTEAEWEYACRAGTTTAYSWGDDPGMIGEYAWYEDNGDFKYQKVGQKLPNPWGLHDMHGNVAEWVLDAYEPNYDNVLKALDNPYNRPKTLYPRAVRGGSWDHPADMARSAARIASEEDWKVQDPQLPKSVWYHTDAQFLGFRMVIPLKVDDVETMFDLWNGGRPAEN